jgi:hypothetical protein
LSPVKERLSDARLCCRSPLVPAYPQLWSFFYPLNFSVVPRHLRPLANSVMSLLFLIILSAVAYQGA